MQIQLSIFICTALKIHVSPATKSVLDQFSSFILETRGETEMKVRSLAILIGRSEAAKIPIIWHQTR